MPLHRLIAVKTLTIAANTVLFASTASASLVDPGHASSNLSNEHAVSKEGAGTLNFFYRFVNYTPDNIGIQSLSVSGFDNGQTEIRTFIDYDHQSLPLSALRSVTATGIDFDFDSTPIEPAAKSALLLVRANARASDETAGLSLLTMGSSRVSPGTSYAFEEAHLTSFSAASAPHTVPLPAPVWTGLVGLLATVIYVLKHKQVV